jgi:hypothetical protein
VVLVLLAHESKTITGKVVAIADGDTLNANSHIGCLCVEYASLFVETVAGCEVGHVSENALENVENPGKLQ